MDFDASGPFKCHFLKFKSLPGKTTNLDPENHWVGRGKPGRCEFLGGRIETPDRTPPHALISTICRPSP